MYNQTINGALAAENIVDRLNEQERTLRWRKVDLGKEKEELIRSADHFSDAGTNILKNYYDIANTIVIDDNEKYRYVVAREVFSSEPASHRRRFRKWIGSIPIRLYRQWRVRGEESSTLIPSGRTKASYQSVNGVWIEYDRKLQFEACGWREFSSWLRAFPWRSWQEKATSRWYIVGSVLRYYVAPNFYELMNHDDYIGYLRDHYPPHPSGDSEETIDLNVYTGHVFFNNPTHAVAYAENFKRTMHELGVLCSPVVGIGGYTDRRRHAGAEPMSGESERAYEGFPQLEEFKQQGLIFDLATLEHRKQRSAELERRLGDPNIPDRRKPAIRRALQEERESERVALDNLKGRTWEEIYGLALDLARERDEISEAKRHAEHLLELVRET